MWAISPSCGPLDPIAILRCQTFFLTTRSQVWLRDYTLYSVIISGNVPLWGCLKRCNPSEIASFLEALLVLDSRLDSRWSVGECLLKLFPPRFLLHQFPIARYLVLFWIFISLFIVRPYMHDHDSTLYRSVITWRWYHMQLLSQSRELQYS